MRVGIRKGALFVMRDMQVIWSMEFPCLLVCQSAIFIDSKRDGTEPFNGRRKPRGAGVRACEERVSGMAGTQGRPLYDGLRLHGLGDRYEQHLL